MHSNTKINMTAFALILYTFWSYYKYTSLSCISINSLFVCFTLCKMYLHYLQHDVWKMQSEPAAKMWDNSTKCFDLTMCFFNKTPRVILWLQVGQKEVDRDWWFLFPKQTEDVPKFCKTRFNQHSLLLMRKKE